MTPEKARKLLDRVKEKCPLPWEIFTTETIESEPRQVENIRYQDDKFTGHLAYGMDYDGTVEIDPDAIELIAAAPALAEVVAGLRYEYAAQVRRGPASPWLYITRNGCFSSRESISGWYTHRAVCATAIRYALRHNDVDTEIVESRVVRRLAGEPEVAE